LQHIAGRSGGQGHDPRAFLRVAAPARTNRSNIGMNQTGLTIILLVCLADSAFAGCESQTKIFGDATVAFMCPADAAAQDGAALPSQRENVLVVEKIPAAEAVDTEPSQAAARSVSETVDVQAAAAGTPAVKPGKAVSSRVKPAKTVARPAKSKKAKSNNRKTATRQKSRIIHIEKPSLGRRIAQFFGM
jgi:hypothetical protein